ncbi:unnamed protein product [Phytophthora lilii]|uniref:Unnamed protein product n=1 Tax=Phytophthora lilii TaxID=2077276 RepID=A0A9W6WPD5_9STRA|nr:unnamed protein product [Phytophthora lilii]
MELDSTDLVSKVNASPFFMSSRPPTASPQSWELHDVDFLLPGPAATSTRLYFQDSARKYSPSLHESEFTFPSELDETTKPLAFRSGTFWQDMALNDPATSEFSTYLVDDGFSSKCPFVPVTPSAKITSNKQVLAPPALHVNAAVCSDEDANRETNLKRDTSVVSPTMVDKKILVSDKDLRLFSTGSSSSGKMKALRRRSPSFKSSPHPGRKKSIKVRQQMKVTSVGQPPVSTMIPRKNQKRGALIDEDPVAPVTTRSKPTEQPVWSAPRFDPRWYWGHTEGFHGMHPRLQAPVSSSSLTDYNGAIIYHPEQFRVSVQPFLQQHPKYSHYLPPKRKIGIYSPAERRERLKRFHEKRKLRVYHKRIKYDCRKRLANSCPRVKGRFVRKSDVPQLKEGDTTSSDVSETASSSEDCQ